MVKGKEIKKRIRDAIALARTIHPALKTAGLLMLSATAVLVSFHLLFWQRIYPGVTVAGIYLGGKTEYEAVQLLSTVTPPPAITASHENKVFTLTTSEISLSYRYRASARTAFLVGRRGTLEERVVAQWHALRYGTNLGLVASYDKEKLVQFVTSITEALSIPSIPPKIELQGNSVVIDPGKTGQEVDLPLLEKRIKHALSEPQTHVDIPVKTPATQLTPAQVKELTARAQKFIGAVISVSLDDETVATRDSELVTLLAPDGVYNLEKIAHLVEQFSQQFSQPVQEPTFRFENGRVQEFKPAEDGIVLEKEKLTSALLDALSSIETGEELEITLAAPVIRTPPAISTGDVNNLGIKELVGRGTSRFRGSIPSRVHNIALAANRLSGILIPPGEVLSFNQALGDVSAFTGYQQAYIIRDGKTILGDGGGVCQVSTTLFRAALNAGLPIVERRAHSYRVGYYEQNSGPGFDATVYDPTTDLKIKNDTPAYILIQSSVDRKTMTLTFELYGTKDGRAATTSKPRVWDVVEPPPDLYQDDPTLPLGTIKQVDFKAWGAKAAFDYKVTRGNEVLQDRTFYSVYRPWQAVYLRGTAPPVN